MTDPRPRTVLVFDVLGTLVDQTGSLERQVAAATSLDAHAVSDIVETWLAFVSAQERAIVDGARAFVPSDELDAEALADLVRTGRLPTDALSDLVDAAERVSLWDDTREGLAALGSEHTVVGLSNASRRILIGLSARTDLRWHGLLSAQDAGTYKPDPALYRTALSSVPDGSETPIMVAAHAWDLRAARAVGMRTAYVPRPNGDAPASGERFDIHATDLEDLRHQLRGV